MDKNNKKIDAILMASGFSSRFGDINKLLYPIGGKPLARHTLDLVCGMDFSKVIFVTSDKDVSSLAQGLDVTHVNNTSPHFGSRESIRLGVLASDADFYMFFTCDQPLLDKETVSSLTLSAEKGLIISPAFNGQPSSPTLFSSAFRRDLLNLKDGEHGRDIKRRYPNACKLVPLCKSWPLFDVDSMDDIRILKFHLEVDARAPPPKWN